MQKLVHRATQAEPARQRDAALPPAERPGNGAQILDAGQRLARGRARADVELRDLLQRRGVHEVVGEARRVHHQRAVAAHAGFGQPIGRLQERLRYVVARGLERAFQHRRHQRFQVAAAEFGVGVLGADHLALLGQADLAAHRARRLRQDGLVAGPAAAPHRAAAAVEQAQPQRRAAGPAVGPLALVEQRGQRHFHPVERPVAHQDAAVLVAVGIAQHHLLRAAAGAQHVGHAGQGQELAHDGLGAPQVGNGLEQRHHHQPGARRLGGALGQRALQQADLLLQQQHLEQVAHLLGVADDGVAHGGRAQRLAQGLRGLEHRQLLDGQRAVAGARHAQRSRVGQQAQQQRAAGRFVQRGVVGADAGGGEQLGHHGLVLVGALAQIDAGQVKAEHLHRALQRVQPPAGQRAGTAGAQRGVDHAQIGQQFAGAGVGRRLARRRVFGQAAGEPVPGGRQPRVDGREHAAVGLVLPVRVVVGRLLRQRRQLGRDVDQQAGQRQLRAQRVHLGEVVGQRQVGLGGERLAQRAGVDVGVAVAVAAHPVAHAQEGRHVGARQALFQPLVQARDLRQEGAAVIAERVLDLVAHGEPGVAQQTRLPQAQHVGAQAGLVGGQLGLAAGLGGAAVGRGQAGGHGQRALADGVALGQQLGDAALGQHHALALHFGRVGGEHGRDFGARQQICRGLARHATLAQRGQGGLQAARLHVAQALVPHPAADVLAVLGQVGQVAEVGEGADHAEHLLDREAAQHAVQPALGRGVAAAAVGDGEPPDLLDQREGVLPLLLGNGVAQQAPQQADVVLQRIGGGGLACHAPTLAPLCPDHRTSWKFG